MLIRQAYGLFSSNNDQIQGLPGWAETDRYNIEAKVASSDVERWKQLTRDEKQAMLRSILEDRFKLQVRHETHQLPVYVLIVSKSGSKLKETEPREVTPSGNTGRQTIPAGGLMHWSRSELTGQAISMPQLSQALMQITNRTVEDKTGLTARYDVSLKWAPEEALVTAAGGSCAGPSALGVPCASCLGLRPMQAQKASDSPRRAPERDGCLSADRLSHKGP